MANAKRVNGTVTRTVVEEVSNVVLTLSENEAVTLAVILRRVGGEPDKSRRGYSALILRALEDSGVDGNKSSDLPWDHFLMFNNLDPTDPRLAELNAAKGL
jgi:hypothetical protein